VQIAVQAWNVDCENVHIIFFVTTSIARLAGERMFSFLPPRTRSRLVELLHHMQEAPFTKIHWLGIY
jgi:hypothetical protein